MNDFFKENFNISKIVVCTNVPANCGGLVHRDRKSHGLVIQPVGHKKYSFETGEMLDVKDDCVFYLPKFSSYKVDIVVPSGCFAINFELADENITFPPFVYKSKNISKILNSFKLMHKAWCEKKDGYLNVCNKHLYEIICEIQSENNTAYLPSAKSTMIDRGVNIINENLSDSELTVSGIAKELGISPEYFRQLFRDVYNISPKKYIINRRIYKAIDLLSLKEYKIKEIAELCGFKDFTYFSTEFKKVTSYSPKEYMNQFFV